MKSGAVVPRAGALLAVAAILAAQTQTAPPAASIRPLNGALRPGDVIAHLEKAIAWYRHAEAAQESSGVSVGVLLRDSAHQNALRALQLAFQFAHAEASFHASLRQAQESGSNGTGAPAAARNLEDTAARAAERVSRLQGQITVIDSSLASNSVKNRGLLEEQRQELQSELGLAQEIQKTVQSMVAFAGANTGSSKSAAAGFTGQINELEQTVPEARLVPPVRSSPNGTGPAGSGVKDGSPAQAKAPVPVNAANANAPGAALRPDTQGLIGLAGTLISAVGERKQIQNLIAETDALSANIETLRSPLVAQLRASIKQSEDIAAAAASENAEQLGSGQKQISALTTQFKQLSTVVVPLGEEEIVVQELRGSVIEWRNLLNQESGAAARYLLMRTGALVLAIFILLVLSEFWKRATFRYVRDLRRRRQFLVIRRVVVTGLILLIFIVGFVTQFGSVATYAGFLTAGLAVALQNVILAVIAYFFLIGRYGVRVGDRVTMGGVTGDVIELGLVRIYLMELVGEAGDLHSTGRVVVFANSVLFQPQALFKQLPGTNYVWHSVVAGLAPDTDVRDVEKRLGDAVDAVFATYRPEIEQQHAVLERSVEIEVPKPKPETGLQFTGISLRFRVRFPVEVNKASEADAEMLRALANAIAQDPKLTLAPDGSPRLERSL